MKSYITLFLFIFSSSFACAEPKHTDEQVAIINPLLVLEIKIPGSAFNAASIQHCYLKRSIKDSRIVLRDGYTRDVAWTDTSKVIVKDDARKSWVSEYVSRSMDTSYRIFVQCVRRDEEVILLKCLIMARWRQPPLKYWDFESKGGIVIEDFRDFHNELRVEIAPNNKSDSKPIVFDNWRFVLRFEPRDLFKREKRVLPQWHLPSLDESKKEQNKTLHTNP